VIPCAFQVVMVSMMVMMMVVVMIVAMMFIVSSSVTTGSTNGSPWANSCVGGALGASLETFERVVNDAFEQGGFCVSKPVEFTLSPTLGQLAAI
jgi:Na+/H+-translocating membrane pyrophosphatase